MFLNTLRMRSLTQLAYRFSVRYSTRQYLSFSSIDPEITKRETKQQQQSNIKKRIYTLSSNDSNPVNYVKVKIRDTLPTYQTVAKQPFILRTQMPIANRALESKRQGFVSSLKKMTSALRGITGTHIASAIKRCFGSHKKPQKLIVPTLFGLLTTARLRGFDLQRVFIHAVLIGKMRRFPSIRYHAKGKSGRMKTDLCHIKIIIQERNEERFYKELAEGKIDPGLASAIKQDLIRDKAPIEQVEKYRDLLTAKGRQQYKLLVQRRVDQIYQQRKARGEQEARKKIQIEVHQQQAQRFKELLTNRRQVYSMLKQREAKYIQNTQKKGRY